MKKIVGILSAAAVLAASVFALDASAAIKFNGSLFDVNFAENAKPKFIKVEEPKAQKGHGQTGIDLNVSTDKAGASLMQPDIVDAFPSALGRPGCAVPVWCCSNGYSFQSSVRAPSYW